MPAMQRMPLRLTKWRWENVKNSSTLDARGSGAVKQGIAFSNAAISYQLEGIARTSFSLALPPEVAVGTSSSTGQVLSEGGLTTNSKQDWTVSEGGTCTIGTSESGYLRGASG